MLTGKRIRVKLFPIDPFLIGRNQSNTQIYSLRKETVASRLCFPENKGPLLYVNLERYEEKGESLGEGWQWPSAKGKSGNRSTHPCATAHLTGNCSLKTERIDVRRVQRRPIALMEAVCLSDTKEGEIC